MLLSKPIDISTLPRYVKSFAVIELSAENIHEVAERYYGVYFEDLSDFTNSQAHKDVPGILFREPYTQSVAPIGSFVVLEGSDVTVCSKQSFELIFRKVDDQDGTEPGDPAEM